MGASFSVFFNEFTLNLNNLRTSSRTKNFLIVVKSTKIQFECTSHGVFTPLKPSECIFSIQNIHSQCCI